MMQVNDLVNAMEQIAPTRFAETWDNVGLLAGDPNREIRRIFLTIDYTQEVAAEGRQWGCQAVVAYHPPIFQPLKRLSAGGVVFDAIERGVAIYSPHTALDVADGGTNDLLADVLGLEGRLPLRPMEAKAGHCKLVTFVPREQVGPVSEAMFSAGAGRIGNYTHCSFQSDGVGTFWGQEGANPTVGSAGQLERVDEVRLEAVVPVDGIRPVIEALRRSHPYEEPAFDLVQLAAVPADRGQGRIGTIKPMTRRQIIERIKHELGLSQVLVAGPVEGTITRAAACAGSCGDLLQDALRQKAELYLTGEMRHHDALAAAQAGMTVICTLHSNSERAVLRRVQRRLQEMLAGVEVECAQSDRDPFSAV